MSDTEEEAQGLVWRPRSNGSQVAYWVARRDLVKAGYRPKTVRLHYAADDPALAARCHVLQAEMLAWSGAHRRSPASLYDSTFASLVRFYETHPDSPYHDLQPGTQLTYSKTMKLLMVHKGTRRVDAVDGSDIRRWYKELCEASSKGWAYYSINVLKCVLSFGTTKRIVECTQLRTELRETKFQGGARRKERITYQQVVAFSEHAKADGRAWMGRVVRLQFELGLRRRDVIGEWINDGVGTDGIRNGKRVWRDGLTWGHIDSSGVLRKLVSKTQFTSQMEAVHQISDYPDLEAELRSTPTAERIGPIVINSGTGLPPTPEQCRYHFRRIATAAGIPPSVWNMDARAGAVTEAYESGATAEEAKALATHTQEKTNRGYMREQLNQSRRAAAKRVGSRKE